MSSTRPSRRATTRKVLRDDSDDENYPVTAQDDSEDDFKPKSRASPRKNRRARAGIMSSASRRDSAQISTNSSVLGAEGTPAPQSPTKLPSPQKPTSLMPTTRRNRLSTLPSTASRQALDQEDLDSRPPVVRAPSLPLSDITASAINEQAPPKATKPMFLTKPLDAVLEKPMDIVIRTRALGLPQTAAVAEPKSRTVIKNLVLTNFKSYAGRQIVGPFHASFSSVVGPNGSGKSNVIDSLLFVFGFRASKMRQGKISALIHNSASYPDLDFCEVEVHFEEVDDLPQGGTVVKPNSTLIISRKAFRTNSSDYFIDGKRSTFTTVTTLLKDRGVDLDHKRFLILQGEVESIAQMKPKALTEHDDGLLEYLEDIIGTSRYKISIEESATEVEALNETCIEKNERFQHIEREKNGLEDNKDKALRQIRLENELAIKQWGLYQVYNAECTSNISVFEEALSQAQTELDQELLKHSGSEKEIQTMEQKLSKQAEEVEKLAREFEAKTQDIAKVEKEQVKLDEKSKFITSKRKKQEKSLQSSKWTISEAKNQIIKHDDDLRRLKGEVVELEDQLQRENKVLEKVRESLKGKTQVYSDQITLRQKDLEPWQEKVNAKKSEITVTTSELDMLHEHASAGLLAIEDARNKIASIMQNGQEKVDKRSALKRAKTENEASYQALKDELSTLHGKEPDLRAKVSHLRQRTDEAKSSLTQTKSHGNVLAGLMRLKETGRIAGFHGRLGNLGTIDQQYDVAISTACPALENLVVDSVEAGQQCIEYLRKNNLGRANIICLDRLAKRDMSMISTPENAPRLFDLVKTKDPRFAPAFYSVLQNTLLAQNLDHANRIAYGSKRWRVVTLDGQLIDVSGTMSGGGTKVVRGAMSAKLVSEFTDQQLSEFESNYQLAESEHNALLSQIRALEVNLKDLVKVGPKLDTDLQMMNLEVETMERSLQDAQKHLTDIENDRKAQKQDNHSIDTLRIHLSKLEKELHKLEEQSTIIEADISRLQDKIMEVGGLELRAQKCKVDMLKEQIETLNEQASKAQVSTSRATKEQVKHEKLSTQALADLELTAKEDEALEREMVKHKDLAIYKQRLLQEAEELFDQRHDDLEKLRKEVEVRTAEAAEAKGIEIELRNRLEENQKMLNENQKRSKYWREKLEHLTLHSLSELNLQEPSEEAGKFPEFSNDELLDMNKDILKAEIAALEEQVQKHNIDLSVLDEYRRRVEEHNARFSELQTAVAGRDLAKKRCDDLRRLRLEGFMEGFGIISMRLKEMYQMITMGGNAELELVDSLDPFSEGILFSVMPPKKSWKNISNLSGGEKTLSSLALVFALHHYKPTPLYVMDEIDAALDFKNVSIVANYIKERTKNAQFIVISLRNNMFELAARLVGIYKVNQMTRSVTVENKDYIVRRRGQVQIQTQARPVS